MCTESVMPSNHLILHCPFLLSSSVFPSIRVFSNESALQIRWPKYWRFSFSISPSNEYSVLISFGMGCLDLLAVQGTLRSLLQHHSSKAAIRWCSAFFMVQLSHLHMTTGKATALTRWTFVGKVMTLLFTTSSPQQKWQLSTNQEGIASDAESWSRTSQALELWEMNVSYLSHAVHGSSITAAWAAWDSCQLTVAIDAVSVHVASSPRPSGSQSLGCCWHSTPLGKQNIRQAQPPQPQLQ